MDTKTSDQKYGLKFTQAQKNAVFYDMEAMLDDELTEIAKGKIQETGRPTRVWSAVKAGTPITKADWAWFQSTVLENIIDIGNDHGDAAGRGRIRCARAMSQKVNDLWSGKPFRAEAPKVSCSPIELKHHGTDEPICPLCNHNNAMLSENPAKATFKCRDCGYTCVSVCFVNLDAPKPIAITTKLNYDRTSLETDLILTQKGSYNRFKIGGVPKGQQGRKVDQGPLVPGPWHFMFGLASVIAANPEHGTYGEMKRARAADLVIEVTDGTQLQIDGLAYTVKKSWNGVLVLVDSKEVKRA